MWHIVSRWWYPAVILAPALVAVVYFSGVVGVPPVWRVLLVALWLVLAALELRRYAARKAGPGGADVG